MKKNAKITLLTASILLLANSTAFAAIQLNKVQLTSLPGWQQDQQQLALPALKRSCQKLLNRRLSNNDPRANIGWTRMCQATLKLPAHITAKQTRQFIERWFTAYKVTNGNTATGLFTGYYEPLIKASLTPTSYFRVPIYNKPKNLVRVNLGRIGQGANGVYGYRLLNDGRYSKLPSRAQIAAGPNLADTSIIAYVHSKVDRFFLQIQGSGGLILPNGKKLLVGYNGQNGYKYFPIGKYLVDSGDISSKNISLQTIRQWLFNNPSQAQKVMNLNPSFVFFRPLSVTSPIGAEGIPLTAGRSLAIDRKFYWLGTPVWLSSYEPKLKNQQIIRGKTINRLMVMQDTGGAIKGVIRGDVFWGPGATAEWLAGHMQSQGSIWVLLPKGVSARQYI